MRLPVSYHLNQLIDDGLGRRIIRIAHAKIDHINSLVTGREFFRVHPGENIRREFFNEVRFGLESHGFSLADKIQARKACPSRLRSVSVKSL